MRKFFCGLGVFGSVVLTIILSILMFLYVAVLNVKFVISENGMANTFKKIDVVETLKTVEDGTVWEDCQELANELNLSEEQFEQILNNDKVKEKVGSYLGEVLGSSLNDEKVNLTKEEFEDFLNVAIDEYNKINDVKISETEREEIVNSFDEEMIEDINEEMGALNLTNEVDPEYVKYVELADNLLNGNYTLIMLMAIILIIILIALFSFSYYKWISYTKASTIISAILMLVLGVLLLVFPLEDMEIIMPLREILAVNVFITAAILFVLSMLLTVGKKYLKKYIYKKNEKSIEEILNESKQVEENKNI